MMRKAGTILLLCLCVTAAVYSRSIINAQYETIRLKSSTESNNPFQNTVASSMGVIDFLSTGIKPLIADYYWIKITTMNADKVLEMMKKEALKGHTRMQVEEEIPRTPKQTRELYDLLKNATYLDPHFVYAYYFGGQILSWDNELTLAINILEDGLKHNKSAMLASSLSFLYFFFLKDWNKGAQYAELSYKFGGKYSASPQEVATYLAGGRNYDMAIRFMSDAIAENKDKDTKKELELRLKYLFVEKYIEYLEKAAVHYEYKYGVKPDSLNDLVFSGIITEIPKDPFGGRFMIDRNGNVKNYPLMRFKHFQEMREHLENMPKGRRDHLK